MFPTRRRKKLSTRGNWKIGKCENVEMRRVMGLNDAKDFEKIDEVVKSNKRCEVPSGTTNFVARDGACGIPGM